MNEYTIERTSDGVRLLKNNRVLSTYFVTQCKNGKWKVRLYGAQYGFEIGQYLPASVKYESIIRTCTRELLEIKELSEAK